MNDCVLVMASAMDPRLTSRALATIRLWWPELSETRTVREVVWRRPTSPLSPYTPPNTPGVCGCGCMYVCLCVLYIYEAICHVDVRFVLATDGVWDVIDEEYIRKFALYSKYKDPKDLALFLAHKAAHRRTKRDLARDDITGSTRHQQLI